jgi:alpha-L-rhamnosidase
VTSVVNLRVESRVAPLAIGEPKPRFGWQLSSESRGVVQQGYRIVVSAGGTTLWDSGVVASRETTGIEYAGETLPFGAAVEWSVEVMVAGDSQFRSASSTFETAPDPAVWDVAQWVTVRRTQYQHDDHRPAPHLRKRIDPGAAVARARLHVTAGGLVEPWIEGERLDRSSLGPGWTDYRLRVPFHTYDVTRFLRGGAVTIGAVLADGWYAGGVGPFHKRNFWGKHPVLKAVLVIDRENGSREIITTDESWEGAFGEIQSADLLQGEVIDARERLTGWSTGSQHGAWRPVTVEDGPQGRPVPALLPGAAPFAELHPVSITEPTRGSLVFDLGQNFAGHIRVTLNGRPGTIVRVRHAEVLGPDGTIYTENLRGARATDTFVLAGDGDEVFEPSSTYHGFRYAEITGIAADQLVSVVGVAVSSVEEFTGEFATGSAMVNQLQSNIQWSMASNFIEVPTDCPSRDERTGWTGDAQIFAPTATFNADVASFYTKWMDDIDDTRMENGALPDIAPAVVMDWAREGSSGYAEAGIIVPWVMYEAYGDTRILERFFDAGAAWVAYIAQRSPDLVWRENRNTDYGDWLAPEETPKDLTATAYFARSAQLLGRYAQALGREQSRLEYESLHARIADAFRAAFVNADGTMPAGTQTAYTLALRFDLLLPDQRDAAAAALARNVDERGHISTGFLAVAQVMPLLSEIGRSDLAYRLLLNEQYPSWGHHVTNGATTIWERWDGWRAETGYQDPLMNSFNHFALGSVGEWMYGYAAGLRSAAPGYARLHVEPRLNRALGSARASTHTVRGPASVDWELAGDTVSVTVVVPANVAATVLLPCVDVLESGTPLAEADGVLSSELGETGAVIEIGSGTYVFTGVVVGDWSAEGTLVGS